MPGSKLNETWLHT